MGTPMNLSESLENYLEVILDLERTNKVARAKEIADRLNIQRGSVTGGLKTLSEKGYINYQPYSFITLTPIGKKLAQEIAHRHQVIKKFLSKVLQIDAPVAEQTACRMEHSMDGEIIERLVNFIEYVFTCPRAGQQWIESFANYCANGKVSKADCDECIGDLKTQFIEPVQ